MEPGQSTRGSCPEPPRQRRRRRELSELLDSPHLPLVIGCGALGFALIRWLARLP